MENLRISFQGIWAHKMRSFLTMLGIIIGIAAIIAIVSTITGTNEQIKENLIGSGDNIVHVQLYRGDGTYTSGDATVTGVPMVDDKIRQEILDLDEVSKVSAYRSGYMYDGFYYLNNSISGVTMMGIDDYYFDTDGYALMQGRLFSEDDRTNNKKMIILDNIAAENIFQGEDPLGKILELKKEPYTVIGVVTEVEKFEPVINSVEEYWTYYSNGSAGKIFVTDNVWPMIYGFDEPYNIIIKAKSTEKMADAGKKTADILNKRIPGASDDNTLGESEEKNEESSGAKLKYKSENLMEKAKSLQDLATSTSKQLIWIAGISLIVGGIGVMNIMLVSVTERTREIGLKKALGAKKSVILKQFLTEAAVLTSLGGILGVIAGIALAYIVSDVAAVPVAISIPAIIISVVFSMVIGIIFGFIPSVKAANLNPIDALRYE